MTALKEPPVRWPHISDRGWYFVRYRDGNITFLMSKGSAREYAAIFGGEVIRHSEAPRPWWKRLFINRKRERNDL